MTLAITYTVDDIQSLTQEFSVLESDDIDDIHNFTDVFSVLDFSSNADNNEFNTCISTDTFPASENQSNEVCSRNNAVLLGWKKLFGGRFIRFMSGMKNETQQLTGSYVYDPQLSKINFACPSENMLANFNPFDDKLPLVFPPGFLEQIIKYKAENDCSKKVIRDHLPPNSFFPTQ